MKKPKKIIIAWQKREHNLKESIVLFSNFLHKLKEFDPNLAVWYIGGKPTVTNNDRVKFDYLSLKKMYYPKTEEWEKPEFNFDFGCWNGAPKESEAIGLIASIGSKVIIGNNNCILDLPYEGGVFEHYESDENFKKLKQFFINYWKPEMIMDENREWVAVRKKSNS